MYIHDSHSASLAEVRTEKEIILSDKNIGLKTRVVNGTVLWVYVRIVDATIRHTINKESLSALEGIEGINYYGVQRDEARSIRVGFTGEANWRQVAPQLILVLARVIDVNIDELSLANDNRDPENEDLSWIVEAAKKLP